MLEIHRVQRHGLQRYHLQGADELGSLNGEADYFAVIGLLQVAMVSLEGFTALESRTVADLVEITESFEQLQGPIVLQHSTASFIQLLQ